MSQPKLEILILSGSEPPLRDAMARLLGELQLPQRLWVVREGSTLAALNPALGEIMASRPRAGRADDHFVLLVGKDVTLLPGSVGALHEALRARPGAGAAGGPVLDERGSFRASFAAFPSLGRELLLASGVGQRLYGPWFPSRGLSQSAELGAVDAVSGACLLVRAEALAVTGLFDPQLAEQDTVIDWCYRLRRGDWELLYVPGAPVIRSLPGDVDDSRALAAGYRSRVRLLRRVRGPGAAMGFKLALAALSLLGKTGPLSPAQIGSALRDA